MTGFEVTLDALALTGADNGGGVLLTAAPINDLWVQHRTLRLLPQEAYFVQQSSGRVAQVQFGLGLDGKFFYGSELDVARGGSLAGAGTSTLTFRGFSVAIDATAVSHFLLVQPIWGARPVQNGKTTITVLPADGFVLQLDNGSTDLAFSVSGRGAVTFDPLLQNELEAIAGRRPTLRVLPPPKDQQAWTALMAKTPIPKKGCFNASYPKPRWQEVPCVKAPELPQNVGNGVDWAATVAGTPLTSATGSFDSVSGVSSETGTTFSANCKNPVANVPNVFSLQLNTTSGFTTKPAGIAACQTAAGCQGWQQFVYSSTYNLVFMQYWLLGFGPTCPAGWTSAAGGCYQNSNATAVPAQTIANLRQLSLTASANSGFDTATVLIAGNVPSLSASNQDSVLNLAPAWKDAEFNVFGDTCASQANFSAGSTIVVRTQVNAGASIAPTCTSQGFTGETNNLNLVGTPATVQSSGEPAIVFTESNIVPGTPSSCTVSRSGLTCVGVDSFRSTSCTDSGGVASTCASATCPQGSTLTGGGGACAAGGRRIKSLFPNEGSGSFTIMCEQQGVDPQAVAICCHL